MEFDYVELISNVGFPIVAFLLLYLDLRRLIKENTESTNALKELITALIAKL